MSEAAIDYGDDISAPQEGDVAEEVTHEAPPEEAQEEAHEQPDEKPAEEEEPPVTFDPRQQEFINEKIVGKKVAQLREAERRAQELEQRLAQYESQKEDGEPTVPPMPEDVFADDYQDKVRQRDEAIGKHAEWRFREQQRQEYEQRQAQEQQQKQMEALQARVQTYTGRAKDFGITEEALKVAGSAVAQIGIHQDVAEMLLDSDTGPAVTVYLSQNVQELAAIQQMSPLQAAIHINRNIEPKVKRKTAKTPPPTETVEGASAPEGKRGPKNATYE